MWTWLTGEFWSLKSIHLAVVEKHCPIWTKQCITGQLIDKGMVNFSPEDMLKSLHYSNEGDKIYIHICVCVYVCLPISIPPSCHSFTLPSLPPSIHSAFSFSCNKCYTKHRSMREQTKKTKEIRDRKRKYSWS